VSRECISEAAANQDPISWLASQLWENAGCPEGRDVEFWLKAKTHLLAPQKPETVKVQTVDPTEGEPVPDAVTASVATVAELDSVSILEAIRLRESTLMENTFRSRPSSHWGLND